MRHLWLLALLAAPGAAHATIVAATSDADLARHADAIVVGVVTKVETRVIARQRVVTHATLAVEMTVHGARVSSVVILVPGGALPNGLGAVVSGVPELRKGERWLAFLERAPDGTYRALGLALGMVRVRDDGTLVRDLTGLTFVGPSGEPVDPKSFDLSRVRLEEQIVRIRRQLGEVTP